MIDEENKGCSFRSSSDERMRLVGMDSLWNIREAVLLVVLCGVLAVCQPLY